MLQFCHNTGMKRLALLIALPALFLAAKTTVGPARGSLVVCGGGKLSPDIVNEFISLAGGLNATIVYIPTAGDANDFPADYAQKSAFFKAGAKNLVLLHTRDRNVADTEAFAAPLRKAGGVWFEGGRQWRLVDSYLNTRTERELFALLARGGVIGGSSAGATIQGSYLVRGAREGNTVMMAKGYEQGLGFLRGVAVDQHLLKRHRENDLLPVIAAHPALLGIGLDEGMAIVVHGDEAKVIGPSKVAIYDHFYQPPAGAKPYYFLADGDTFNLKTRRAKTSAGGKPTLGQAQGFMDDAEARLLTVNVESGRADWVKDNFITNDTELLAAKADQRSIDLQVDLVKQSGRFDGMSLPDELARKMKLLKADADHGYAGGSGRSGRVDAHPGRTGRHLRQRQVLPGGQGQVPGSGRPRQDHGEQPQSGRAARRLGRLARHRQTDAKELHALRRAGQ